MKETWSVKEPPCPLDEHNFRGCLTFVEGKLTYYINRRCKASLLWVFWSCRAKWPYYEDPSLGNEFYERLTTRENWVPYCETTIIKEEDVAKREGEYPNGYRRRDERLDFYVTKLKFAEAYQTVQRLGRPQGNEQVTEATIFGSLRVVLLATAEFGERAGTTSGTDTK